MVEKDNTTTSSKQEFSFKCGQMLIENGKVKPDPSKGIVKISYNPDGLLCWQWINLNDSLKNSEPIVIFSDEWEIVKVSSKKGRVFQLKSKCFDDYYVFWMQEPDATKDSEIEEGIKKILTTGVIEIKEKSKRN